MYLGNKLYSRFRFTLTFFLPNFCFFHFTKAILRLSGKLVMDLDGSAPRWERGCSLVDSPAAGLLGSQFKMTPQPTAPIKRVTLKLDASIQGQIALNKIWTSGRYQLY